MAGVVEAVWFETDECVGGVWGGDVNGWFTKIEEGEAGFSVGIGFGLAWYSREDGGGVGVGGWLTSCAGAQPAGDCEGWDVVWCNGFP